VPSGSKVSNVEDKIKDIDLLAIRDDHPLLEPLSPSALMRDLDFQHDQLLLVQVVAGTLPCASCTFSVYEIALTCILKEFDSSIGGVLEREVILQSSTIEQYDEIIINVEEWGVFDPSDLTHNDIETPTSVGDLPDFVDRFHKELDHKPGMERNQMPLIKLIPKILDYFIGWIHRGRSSGPNRNADPCEVMHLGMLANLGWEKLWNGSGQSLKREVADSMLFHVLSLYSQSDVKAATVKLYVLTSSSSHRPIAI